MLNSYASVVIVVHVAVMNNVVQKMISRIINIPFT